ncbi:hypothetical protein PHISP_02421 [Aspergillus sp. HF37]|nr:hypothetical protein PHISP_02421 [Aspergillus sp. HF37]
MPPAERSSNWDFTPVISLLHSPAYGGGDYFTPLRHTDADPPVPGGKLDNGANTCGFQEEDLSHAKEHPRLGDFGTLWGLLSQNSTAPTAKSALPGRPCQDARSSRPPESPKQIRILKRPSSNAKHTDPLSKTPPPSCPRTIPVPRTSQPRSFEGEPDAQTDVKDRDSGNKEAVVEGNSSQSSAEADSDGNISVFDTPVQKELSATSLIPPQVGIPAAKNPPLDTPPSSYDSVENTLNSETVKSLPKSNRAPVRPIAYRSAAARKVGLLTKLLKGFPDYADIVSQFGRTGKNKTKGSSSRPVHVFVDISNIMVGFHDSMKVSRGIPISTRIPRLPLSFENFSLILERGRRAKKRVLVGSDRFQEIDAAEKIGYEANILDRVQKGRYLAQRQLRPRKGQRSGATAAGCPAANDANRARWVEQGVDEILHLKILESLVDTDEPTTIVLATGDAAEAEYSEGFMKMVKRALKRGWTVELVSFSQTTSSEYRKEKFREEWGDRFKMVELDEYMEELLDM